jgi:hypothetical protein
MLRFLGFGCVAASLFLFASGDALGQKKDKKANPKDGEMANAQDYIGIQSVKELVGKIQSIDAGSKSLTLQVDFPHMEPNPNYKPNAGGNNNQYQQLNNLYRDQQQLANARTPQQRAQLQNRIMMDYQRIQQQQMQQMVKAAKGANPNNQNGPYKIVHSFKNFELDVKDKVVVRKLVLGTEYDDTGNLKTYTKAQLAEMRGSDTSKPGYTAKYDDLVAGQEVKVFLTAPKTLAKKGAKNDDEGIGNIEKPTIHMILMTKEPPSGISTGAPPKKGKN